MMIRVIAISVTVLVFFFAIFSLSNSSSSTLRRFEVRLCAFGALFSGFATCTAFSGGALVLPGQHQQGVDLSGQTLSEQAVKEWELSHHDLVFGHYPDRADNERVNAIGYMYNQKLDVNSGELEDWLRNATDEAQLDYEDLFLHFAEDTIIAEVDSQHGVNTILSRKPMIVGYTASQDHAGFWLYQTPPWDADVFENSAAGGALYVYHSEPFDRLTFKFSSPSSGGEFVIEYPSEVGNHGRVTHWSSFDIKKDKTQGMTRNQAVIWHLPSDWQRANTHDGSGASYGGGQYFGSPFVRDGGRLFVVRVRWQSAETRPRLAEVLLKNSFPIVSPEDAASVTQSGLPIERWRKICGFDRSADVNQDGYLSAQEYRQRENKNATARFRWESRVIPFGRMWDQNSSWALTHLANPNYLALMGRYHHADWQAQGLKGAYNDDTNKLLGPNQFELYSGGLIAELSDVVGSESADAKYRQQFADFLSQLTELTKKGLVSVNIGTANLFGRNGQNDLVDAASLYLREHYVFPSTGLSGYAGLAKFWDNAALAAAGQKVIFQASTRYGRVDYQGHTEQNWRDDQYSAFVVYALNAHRELSYFNQWNSGYRYGSDNTTAETYWQTGVPKNIAYQPTHLHAIDLGAPLNTIPDGKQAMPLMLSTTTPTPADYTVVGDSTDSVAVHPDLPQGMVSLLPTYVYFAYQSEQTVVPSGPQEMVLARDFAHGRVLYRTDFFGKNADYFAMEPIVVPLGKLMRPVDRFGNIGDYVTQIELGGYQGMILLD